MLFAAKFDCFISMLVEIALFGVVLFGMIEQIVKPDEETQLRHN